MNSIKPAMMVVATRANPGKEAAYNKWYDEHVSLLFTFKGMQRISRNLCALPLGEAGGNSPGYITVYELADGADIEKFHKSPQMQGAKVQFEEGWNGLGEVLWSGWYEPVKTLERRPLAANRYMEIVGSGPKPGKDKAYLDYYIDHFTKMFEYPGVRKVSYSRCIRKLAQDHPNPEYVTVYDFESRESMQAFYKHPVFTGAGKDWKEIGQPVMDLQWAACYESVKTLER